MRVCVGARLRTKNCAHIAAIALSTTCLTCVTSLSRPRVEHVKHALAVFVELACS